MARAVSGAGVLAAPNSTFAGVAGGLATLGTGFFFGSAFFAASAVVSACCARRAIGTPAASSTAHKTSVGVRIPEPPFNHFALATV